MTSRSGRESEQALAETVKQLEAEADGRLREALEEARAEADQRIAAAEQRAAEAEAAAAEAQGIAVRLETEIEERVMQGTEEVRREAEERVRKLVEKVEGEAEEAARDPRRGPAARPSRTGSASRPNSARSALGETAEEEIKASANRARREALAAADETAPAWARREQRASTVSGYRTF